VEPLTADYWLSILVLGAVVYLTRVIGLVAIPSRGISMRIDRRLRLVPVAILTALVAPRLFTPTSVAEPQILLASTVTLVAAFKIRQPVLALVVGVVALVALRAVM
jgi:branched-subunit amino acid transport protein